MHAVPDNLSVSRLAIGVAVLTLVGLAWLGVTAAPGTHPLFYFGLISMGGGSLGLLFAGVGGTTARARLATSSRPDPQFLAGIRTLALAMWLCALVADAFGALIILAIAGGRGGAPALSAAVSVSAFGAAAATIICAGAHSFVVRRALRSA